MEELWRPTAEQAAATHLAAFMRRVGERHGLSLRDYEALHAWSVADLRAFWGEVWDFAKILHSEPARAVLDDSARLPGARWFSGARLNFAENLLRFDDTRPALIGVSEGGQRRVWSHSELRREVARVAAGLRELGVGPGDRVAGLLPNVPEAVIAMLAAASLGAVWSSCSPDFGVSGIVSRFGQIAPRVLFAADGYRYAGREHDTLELTAQVAAQLPGLERIVGVPFLRGSSRFEDGIPYAELGGRTAQSPLEFAQLPFDHPLYILYSSGTTGPPKCIVHGAGGTLLQHAKEHLLHTDLRQHDRLFYFTTCGWMMWNWLVSGLAHGAAIVLYDGSPLHPRPDRLFALAAAEGVTHFGTSPRYLAALEHAVLEPAKAHDLGPLRAILSTGAPLPAESFRYVYRSVKRDVRLSSISGGTDIVSCFFAGNPLGPVRAGELQCRALGMRVEAWNEQGQPVTGEKGELVCTAAFPSVPLGFWNDPDGSRFRSAYFERFPGVWHHGDFVEIRADGAAVVYGRSDATLNPGGVRIGTAELYREVETLPEIEDSLAVSQDWQGDVRTLLFVQLHPGHALDGALEERIRRRIRSGASPRHVPALILCVDAIPYTRNGKKVELAVRETIHGRPVRNLDALANPESLAQFRRRIEEVTPT